jgi:photosystem II stability/assembly factor-like uncharacterized protein
MKKAITLILGIIISNSYAQDEHWERLTPAVNGDTIFKVHFIDEKHGVIVKKTQGYGSLGNYTKVHHSSDSGRTWTESTLNNNELLVSREQNICHSDLNTVWMAGLRDNKVYKSVDKGKNWELAVIVDSLFTIRKILFPTPSVGYFFAGFSSVERTTIVGKTTDGGENWSLSQIDNFIVIDASFLNADTGWVVGSPHDDCLLKTVNGGVTWENMHFGVEQYGTQVASVFFSDCQVGWIGGFYNEFVAGTRDGGNTWTVLRNNLIGPGIEKIHFINENVGWAFRPRSSSSNPHGLLMNTTDGGKSWDHEPRIDTERFVGFSDMYFDSLNGWAVGSHNSILRTKNYGGLEGAISVKPSSNMKQNQVQMPVITLRNKILSVAAPFNSNYQIRFVDMRGKTVARFKALGSSKFSLANIPTGHYVVETKGSNGFKATSAIVVNK